MVTDDAAMTGPDAAALLIRLSVGFTLFAHGWNHAFRGGRIPGTARWFGSIGFRAPRFQAVLATVTELVAGPMLVLGLLTPLAAAAGLGTMVVALISNHLKNGFFIFRPGEGYEYVLMISMVCVGIGALGGQGVSLDNALGLDWTGAGWGLVTFLLGAGAAATTLALFWRRPQP